jgi:signal transduction histidine kinase
VAPVLLWCLFLGVLVEIVWTRLRGDEPYDEAVLQEWVEEARIPRDPLPGLIRDYCTGTDLEDQLLNADRIREQLKALGDVTKTYQGYLPLFPTIYRLDLRFDPPRPHVLVWDSRIPRQPGQTKHLAIDLYQRDGQTATLHIDYLLHAYDKRQRDEQAANVRVRGVSILAVTGTVLAVLWIWLVQRREGERRRHQALAQQQLAEAETRRLEEELRRRGAEQRHEEAERKFLEQRLATQAAERQALELKSQLYASIGIMAGSYAHNIKNLLVRPHDLLRRCLEVDGLSADQEHMLQEVRQTLGTVTERLQQILRTVRRDPSHSEMARLDLNGIVRDLVNTWKNLALEKWKLSLEVEQAGEPICIEGDASHLQQAVENLLFNARDATFEMRSHLREQARSRGQPSSDERRQALISAAGWRGRVALRTRRQEKQAVLEIQDNGIGMTEEVSRRCTETHFSTKRDSALHAGNSVGMGLGLSFVVAILEHHRATMEIESKPLHGATFRVRFPLVPEGVTEPGVAGAPGNSEDAARG